MNARAPTPNDEEQVIHLEGFGPKDLYAKREKIFTRYAGGFFQRLRFYTGWPFLFAYFLTPWLSFNDRPLVLFDLPARQFHVFGADHVAAGFLAARLAADDLGVRAVCGDDRRRASVVRLYLPANRVDRHLHVDGAGGRGAAACAHAVWIRRPWSFTKLRKRVFKHAMWLGFAALTALTFVGYFTPIRALVADLASFQAAGWAAFWVLFFTAATYMQRGFHARAGLSVHVPAMRVFSRP